VTSAITGGNDVISMPRYFKHWEQGLPDLRRQLKKVDDLGFFSAAEKKSLKEQMRAAGMAADQLNSIPLTGRGRPLLAVFDPASLKMTALFKAQQEMHTRRPRVFGPFFRRHAGQRKP
jgi:hypothetical protein